MIIPPPTGFFVYPTNKFEFEANSAPTKIPTAAPTPEIHTPLPYTWENPPDSDNSPAPEDTDVMHENVDDSDNSPAPEDTQPDVMHENVDDIV